MGLKEDISADMKAAMRAREKEKLATLRFILAAIQTKEKELLRDLEDTEVEVVILKQVKQREDSINQFAEGGRADLAEKERAELAFLKAFMPEQMGEDEIRAIVKAAVEETGATSMREMGAVMKVVMPQVKGKADGNAVNNIVKELLA